MEEVEKTLRMCVQSNILKALKMEVEKLLMEIIQSRVEKIVWKLVEALPYNLFAGTQKISYNLQLIIDECKTLFFTGHETAGVLLTWTVMLLATNPSWFGEFSWRRFRLQSGSLLSSLRQTACALRRQTTC